MEAQRGKLFAIFWWALTLTWAGLIFYLSTGTFSSRFSQGLLWWVLEAVHWRVPPRAVLLADNVFRTLAHMTEYAILALLLYGRGSGNQKLETRGAERAARARRAAWCVLAAFLYSLTDEFHQMWVPGRHASLLDCGLDTLGASVAMLAPLTQGLGFRDSGPAIRDEG